MWWVNFEIILRTFQNLRGDFKKLPNRVKKNKWGNLEVEKYSGYGGYGSGRGYNRRLDVSVL